ncbi:portal protein [Rhizorhabdus wittichii]|uniref:portal protein n=1 Tax=Rhizorhabdus wittichii TaxID=160791 RepID=UPI000366C288|nr:portal protein [Rhizorhabdus wittichii]
MADKASKSRIPPGYKDEDEFLAEARDLFQSDADADFINREAALDDLKFAANFENAQWDQTVLAQRAGRPCLTTNVLPQYINQVVGDSIINRPAIKVRPAEDADEDLAEVREGVIRAIEYQSDATRVYTRAGQAQVTCGRGFFRLGLKYASDETFDRDIVISLIPDALSVIVDAMSIDPTAKDAKRIFINDLMPKKEFDRRWPDQQPSDLDAGIRSQLMAQGWLETDTVRVTEYWKMVEEEVEIGLTPDGRTEVVNPKRRDYLRTRKVRRERPWMWLITGHAILDGPHKVPVDRIPVFKVTGQEYFVGPARVTFGLVRFMKDEQRLQNYADSVIAETLATTPKIMWTAEASAVENREAAWRNAHRTADPLLVYNDGFKAPERADQFIFPSGLLAWRQMLTQSMKDVTGLHDASLGIQSNETSGRAILARQREGDVATIVYHDNLNASIAECGRTCNQLIPVVYDTARTIRIVGEDEATKVIRINDPNDPDAIDMTSGKYDIVVDTGPSYATKRVEAAESMMAFVQAVPTAAAAAADLIASAQDWPMAQEIGDRLKKMLPPGVVDADPEKMSPEERQAAMQAQAAAQQQAQQQEMMAQAAFESDLEEKQAKAELATAQARRANAEALKAEQDAELSAALQQADIRLKLAQAAKAEADAQAAMNVPEKDEAQARLDNANAEIAEAEAHDATINAAYNEADVIHKITHGRGITDPEPAPEGADA